MYDNEGSNQGCATRFPRGGGSTFREIPQGGGFDCTILASGGVRLQDFRREAPEIGAEGAVLENFCDFSEKLLLKNEGKSENLGVWG